MKKPNITIYIVLILLILLIISYLFVSSPVNYDIKPSVSGDSIVYKANCSVPLLKCKANDRVIFKINEITPTSSNLRNAKITKDELFDVEEPENKTLIKNVLKNMSVNVSDPSFFQIKDNNNMVISNMNIIDCKIISSIMETDCDENKKKYAYYNVTTPNTGGVSCQEVINNIPYSQTGNYNNWVYLPSQNKIRGEKNCIDGDCRIVGDMLVSECDQETRNQTASYNVIDSYGDGLPCSSLVSTLTLLQKKDFENWRFDPITKKIVGTKKCIPNVPCRILGNLIENNICETNYEKKIAYYNVNLPEGSALNCTNLASLLTPEQKKDYTDWEYMPSKNIIQGYKECCNPGQKFYNNQCFTGECPNYTYKSKNGKMCFDFDCNSQDKVIASSKQCTTSCPSNKVTDGRYCRDNCEPKFENDKKCVEICPDDKLGLDINNKCVASCPSERPVKIENEDGTFTCNSCFPKYNKYGVCVDNCNPHVDGDYYSRNSRICYGDKTSCLRSTNESCCAYTIFNKTDCGRGIMG